MTSPRTWARLDGSGVLIFKLVVALFLTANSVFASSTTKFQSEVAETNSRPTLIQALRAALNEPLELIGTYIPRYSQSQKIPVCIYGNSLVLVKYTYCLSSNVPAAGVTIYWLNSSRAQFSFYAEGPSTKDITDETRTQYFPDFWYLSTQESTQNLNNTDVRTFQKYDEAQSESRSYGCVTGGGLRDMPKFTDCERAYQAQLKSWTAQAYPFWQAPAQEWYDLLRVLKDSVPTDISYH